MRSIELVVDGNTESVLDFLQFVIEVLWFLELTVKRTITILSFFEVHPEIPFSIPDFHYDPFVKPLNPLSLLPQAILELRIHCLVDT
jgi:hypothetical protein